MNTFILPDEGLTKPVKIPIVVVFPAPLGPNSPKNDPSRILRSIPFKAFFPFEYFLCKDLISIAFIFYPKELHFLYDGYVETYL